MTVLTASESPFRAGLHDRRRSVPGVKLWLSLRIRLHPDHVTSLQGLPALNQSILNSVACKDKFRNRRLRLTVLERILRSRRVPSAQAGLAPVARGFSRRAVRRIAEQLFKNHH